MIYEDGVARTAERLREAMGEHKVTLDGETGLVKVTTTGSGLKAASDHDSCWTDLLPTFSFDESDKDENSDGGEQGEQPGANNKNVKNVKKTKTKQEKKAKSPGKNIVTVARKASQC